MYMYMYSGLPEMKLVAQIGNGPQPTIRSLLRIRVGAAQPWIVDDSTKGEFKSPGISKATSQPGIL